MIGELYKEEEGYYLFVNTVIFGTTRPLLNFDLVKHKLSLENCEEIERDVPKNDLDGWDVEIEQVLIQSSIDGEAIWKYKLDDDGCIILKKK
jgi:hypothetical protein